MELIKAVKCFIVQALAGVNDSQTFHSFLVLIVGKNKMKKNKKIKKNNYFIFILLIWNSRATYTFYFLSKLQTDLISKL